MTTGRDVVFVQVEVGAISASADLARAVGMTENDALAGLIRFWHHAIRDNRKIEENSRVDGETLQIVTQQAWGRDVPAKQLEVAGFLAKEADGLWRVRGMSRYVDMEKRREHLRSIASTGGQASASKRAEAHGSSQPKRTVRKRRTDGRSGVEPSSNRPSNEDGRRETGDVKRDTGKKPASRPQNEFAEMLFDAFKEEMGSTYKHSKEDFIGLAGILKAETKDEVMLRWRRGLRKKKDTGYGPSTIAQLASGKFWNDLAIERKPFGGKQAQAEPASFVGHGEITSETFEGL